MGIASLVFGVISLCPCCYAGCWSGLIAIILGVLSMQSSEDPTDRTCGIIGTVLGGIGIVLMILWVALGVGFGIFSALSASSPHYY